MTISGVYHDSNNKPLDESITIRYFDIESNREQVYEPSKPHTTQSINGTFSDNRFIPGTPGIYLVEAESESKAFASYYINAVDFTSTTSFKVLIIIIMALIILGVVTSFIKYNKPIPISLSALSSLYGPPPETNFLKTTLKPC